MPSPHSKHVKPSTFRFLDLAPELRLRIYSYLIPSSERLILDPANIHTPGPFQKVDYGTTASLVRVNKQIYEEVIPKLYTSNTVTMIEPLEFFDLQQQIGVLATSSMVALECSVAVGLPDLAEFWDDLISSACCSLKSIKLVFYHSTTRWLYALTEYALHACDEGDIELRLELFNSIWARDLDSGDHQQQIGICFQWAERRAKMLSYTLPAQLETLTVTASAAGEAAYAFATYKHCSGYRFNSEPSQDDSNKKCLVWEES